MALFMEQMNFNKNRKKVYIVIRINSNISKVVLSELKNHLWYLSSDLILLTLYDDRIDCNIKHKILLKKLFTINKHVFRNL
uniref:Uncharacterized protein n=1 Tax=Megaselia scalaris TaxID=36166 RepID=T1GDY8_MEGSC